MSHPRHGRTAPTHHELIAVDERLDIARNGLHVLERHRDGLVFELLDLLGRWSELRTQMEAQYRKADRLHVYGMIREGDIALRELSNARSRHPELLVGETKLLGVDVPRILSTSISTPPTERGNGTLGASSLDDEIVTSYEQLLELVVKVAELRAVLSHLAAEIRRLRVRINYLDHRLIPDLEAERRYIRRYLDEREGEERSRQFWVRERRRKQRERRTNERTATAVVASEGRPEPTANA